jgi:hypothetical protein
MRRAFPLVGWCTALSVVVSACLSRPVVSTEPHTSNLFVAPIRNEVIDKIDLLFMIDNSRSMGDKQKLLAKAVPELVGRLVVPRCVSEAGAVHPRASLVEACPADMRPEFRAVKDIHVAVITSSLGSHGAKQGACSGVAPDDDRGLLLPSVRSGLTSYNNAGFLAWDPDRTLSPPGETDPARLGQQFGEMVQAAGEGGCGYESSLEAWYRFLIDPEPPKTLAIDGAYPNQRTIVTDVDQEVLSQRSAFLRPDSLVAVVMLTDENDCSIQDDAFGFMAADSRDDGFMWRANSACEKDPNDRCCAPCLANAPSGCPSNDEDPVCKPNKFLQRETDPTNLRCLQNKRRFGYDFLYPTSRYVDGLTQPLVPQRSTGEMVENPLFKRVPGVPRRDKGLVYLAGIVGVPWQDIADDASQKGTGLRYLSAQELTERKRWQVIAGAPDQNLAPTDPFMLESVAPRSGSNPVTGDAIVPETSLNPRANAINGHEQADLDGSDLQYACTFQLTEPAACSDDSCDCNAPVSMNDPGELKRNRPLCQPPSGGPAVATQYFGKAYPGLRPLQVLQGIGDSAIVASICPKVLTEGAPGYGYEPAVDAIVDRLKTALNGRCLPRPLAVAADAGGKLPCVVVEAAESEGSCSCDAVRRQPASGEARDLVMKQLAERQECGTKTTPSCSSFCLCELGQSEGPSLDQCLNSEAGSDTPGYCYVNPAADPPQGNPALVAGCGASKQLIRFVGPDTPRPGATTFIACLGASLN